MASTGNPAIDVNNPLYKEAEERVLRWLRRKYGYSSVEDLRRGNLPHDFVVRYGNAARLKTDVKADQYMTQTGNVAWEEKLVLPNKTERDGWGRKDIDRIVYVAPQTWEALLVDAHAMRTLAQGGGFQRRSKLNPGRYAAHVLLLPIVMLEDAGAVLRKFEV